MHVDCCRAMKNINSCGAHISSTVNNPYDKNLAFFVIYIMAEGTSSSTYVQDAAEKSESLTSYANSKNASTFFSFKRKNKQMRHDL